MRKLFEGNTTFLEDFKEWFDNFKPLFYLGAISSLIAILASSNLQPTSRGQDPVVQRKTLFSQSWGYDYDNDEKLDYAKEWIWGGRSVLSTELTPGTLEYNLLQKDYSKK